MDLSDEIMKCPAQISLAILAFAYSPPPSASSVVEALQIERTRPPRPSRREVMGSISAICAALLSPQTAGAVYNPLNLKGSFWETGELYVKKGRDLPDDPDELLPSLVAVAAALESLNDLVLEGRWEDLSRKLRGGVISESQIRLRGYALLDILPDKEDSRLAYICGERFRIFLSKFAQLDAVVEAAARQSKIDGGLVETVGMAVILPFSAADRVAKITNEPTLSSDPRLNVLNALGETTKAAKAFTRTAEEALKST